MGTQAIRSLGIVTLAVVMAAALGACKKDTGATLNPSATESGSRLPSERTTVGDALPEFDEEQLFTPATGLEKVMFDYNSYSLRTDAIEALGRNAEKIKRVPGVIIQIEGHCDERGTQEYNLALGERRALATRSHLMNLGVSGDRLITISYGEEDPIDMGHSESSWAQNRRAEFNRAM